MKQLYTYIALILLISFTACERDEMNLPEIKIGDGNQTEIKVDKTTTIDLELSGGNGKFTATVADVKIATTKIEGKYLKITGVNYGETKVIITSHDKKRELTIKVERPDFNLSETDVTLYPGETERIIKITGGGDDAEIKVEDPEEALTYKWDAKSNNLILTAKHEGEIKVKFISKDDKPAKELMIKIKAEDPEKYSEKIGLYNTTSKSLFPVMQTVLNAYRQGKMVWIANSTRFTYPQKSVQMKPVTSPQKGKKVSVNLVFTNLDKYPSNTYELIVEDVLTDKGLVVLRGKGFKIVTPFDK